jgi:hypothetical protein
MQRGGIGAVATNESKRMIAEQDCSELDWENCEPDEEDFAYMIAQEREVASLRSVLPQTQDVAEEDDGGGVNFRQAIFPVSVSDLCEVDKPAERTLARARLVMVKGDYCR